MADDPKVIPFRAANLNGGRKLRKMPAQKPGNSCQTYGTPEGFLAAVKRKFGVERFSLDLAADEHNAKANMWFDEKADSLKQDWSTLEGDLWLNPPFDRLREFTHKCKVMAGRPHQWDRLFLLFPLSISNWFVRNVEREACVYLLHGRLTFEGCTAPYPKDCALAVYYGVGSVGLDVWSWKVED